MQDITDQVRELSTKLALVTMEKNKLAWELTIFRKRSERENIFDMNSEDLINHRLGEILMNQHLTRLRCDDVIIEAKVLNTSINVTYPDGLRIKYVRRDEDTHIAKLYLNGDKIKIMPVFIKTFTEVKIKTGPGIITLYKGDCGAYYAAFKNGFSTMKCGNTVTVGFGTYSCELAREDDYDCVTIRDTNGKVYFEMFFNGAPIVRINDKVSFNCCDLEFIRNKW